MRARQSDAHQEFESVCEYEKVEGDPCVDVCRLETSGVLSILMRTVARKNRTSQVVVFDLNVGEM
ncbi:hypothetical protein WAI453_006945 [Rhynchosporium graminicola]